MKVKKENMEEEKVEYEEVPQYNEEWHQEKQQYHHLNMPIWQWKWKGKKVGESKKEKYREGSHQDDPKKRIEKKDRSKEKMWMFRKSQKRRKIAKRRWERGSNREKKLLLNHQAIKGKKAKAEHSQKENWKSPANAIKL